MSQRQDILDEKSHWIAACVERKYKGIFGFTPRRAYEGPCSVEADNLFRDRLAAASAGEYAAEDATNQAYIDKILGNGSSQYGVLIAVFIFLLVITIIIL